ncbi:O-antigen ligase family protein [Pseudoalteromonas undina]|uniref:O-antigen ligase family protein n=1 Tax=Pseudoalteromonas undina TaxID=43660 RepID=UPI0018696708|nr:O-antigen ligase family protein [Pseudoalteromonas undina]
MSFYIKNNFVLFGISFLLLAPVALETFQVSSKPVFFVLSDFLIIIISILFFCHLIVQKGKFKFEKYSRYVMFCIVGLFILGLLGAIRLGELTPLLSSIKLFKSFLFFLIGYYLASRLNIKLFIKSLSLTSLIIICILVISDVIWGSFPIPRLGGYFFHFEVYGFPNSPAVFYTVLFSLVFLGGMQANGIRSYSYFLFSIVISVIIVATLSRAAMLNLMIYIMLMFLLRRKGFGIYLCFLSGFFLILLSFLWVNHPELISGLANKFAKFEQGKDASNGRFEIWFTALDLFSKSPIWGYLFEPFSNYDTHDTPHNQNIEVIFKGGLLGALFYYTPLFLSFMFIWSKRLLVIDKELRGFVYCYLCLVVSIFITNNFQPNFSYTPTGSILFFFSGFLVKVILKRENEKFDKGCVLT